MNIQYQANDGSIRTLGDNELAHFKYIKKIKSGSGWRYFYTPEEIKAYYQTEKALTNVKYDLSDGVRKTGYKMADNHRKQEMNKRINKDAMKVMKKYRNKPETESNRKQAEKDLYKAAGKHVLNYGKETAKSKAKMKMAEKKNNYKRKLEPILNTSKGILTGSAPHIAKLEKGKSKTKKNYSVTTKTIKEKINGKTVVNNRSTLTPQEEKLKKKYKSKNKNRKDGKVTTRTLKETVR